ncbi:MULTISPECIES: polysaccharide deacetylase family protein [Desulfovibrio]|uniref:polysaccharide deacetylase family protein n=1 Tax=Desulfovibrio TaxID=872 RepID=UPI002C053887|nr:polysaccharide deacetylase family protein [Desulfovibrio sp.]HMM37624.1 polysaccharide deacetylase family protein [Desulfovibrio sp.]
MRKTMFSAALLLAAFLCLTAGPARAQGMVTLVFDDGLASVYDNALPILEKNGLPAVTALIAENVRWPHGGYMTKEQALDLQKRGWEIASHSIHHIGPKMIPLRLEDEPLTLKPVKVQGVTVYRAPYAYSDCVAVFLDDLPLAPMGSIQEMLTTGGAFFHDKQAKTLTVLPRFDPGARSLTVKVGSYERELRDSRDELRGHGLDVSAFVAPFSQWTPESRNLSTRYYTLAASLGDGVNEPAPAGSGVIRRNEAYDLHNLERYSVRAGTSLEELQELIRQHAMVEEDWVVLCLHGVGADAYEPISEKKLAALADWLRANRVSVVTLSQGALLLGLGR